MEKAFYFENEGSRLFGMLYEPYAQLKEKETAFVICSSLFEEKIRNQRILVNWARYLATNGYHSLLFDYRGDGDSDGMYDDYTYQSRIDDILTAIDKMKEISGKNNIILHGLRYGASLAYAASHRICDLSAILLWAPIINIEDELKKLLRANVTTQILIHKKVLSKIEDLVIKLLNDEFVNVEGYHLTGPFYKDAIKCDLLSLPLPVCKKILIVQMSNNVDLIEKNLEAFVGRFSGQDNNIILASLGQEIDWKGMRNYKVYPEVLFQRTLEDMNKLMSHSGMVEIPRL